MRYADHLRVEGTCSLVLGAALVLVAWPGRFDDFPLWHGVAVAVVACLGVAALGRFRPPGRWFTERPLATIRAGGVPLDARRRLVVETVLWVVLLTAWLAWRGESGALVWGTGVASALFGWAQAVPARARVLRDAPTAVVTARPALGTPKVSELTTERGSELTSEHR